MNSSPNRAFAHPENARGLYTGDLLEVAKNESNTKMMGELAERRTEASNQFLRLSVLVRACGRVGWNISEALHRDVSPCLRAEKVARKVGGDAQEPTHYSPLLAESPGSPPSLEKRALNQVFDVTRIGTNQSRNKSKHCFLMTIEERTKGRSFANGNRSNQGFIGHLEHCTVASVKW